MIVIDRQLLGDGWLLDMLLAFTGELLERLKTFYSNFKLTPRATRLKILVPPDASKATNWTAEKHEIKNSNPFESLQLYCHIVRQKRG